MRATDRSIMDWAESNGYMVFTHDLDFGTLLALTHKTGPSVLQVRGEDVLPDHMGNLDQARRPRDRGRYRVEREIHCLHRATELPVGRLRPSEFAVWKCHATNASSGCQNG